MSHERRGRTKPIGSPRPSATDSWIRNALRPAGSSWTVPGSVVANAAPAADRVLLGNVQVRTDMNVLVGQGDVIVESVQPAP